MKPSSLSTISAALPGAPSARQQRSRMAPKASSLSGVGGATVSGDTDGTAFRGGYEEYVEPGQLTVSVGAGPFDRPGAVRRQDVVVPLSQHVEGDGELQ